MCVCLHPQGRITVVREVDYEISGGRYTLIITATDQCPVVQLRLTSSATVSDTDTRTCNKQGVMIYLQFLAAKHKHIYIDNVSIDLYQ